MLTDQGRIDVGRVATEMNRRGGYQGYPNADRFETSGSGRRGGYQGYPNADRFETSGSGRRGIGANVRVLASPLVRARETAEIVSRIFSSARAPTRETAEMLSPGTSSEPVAIDARLKSGSSLKELLGVIVECWGDSPLVMVGHMPEFGILAWWLATGERGKAFDLAPGSVVALSVEWARNSAASPSDESSDPGALMREGDEELSSALSDPGELPRIVSSMRWLLDPEDLGL